MSTFF
jgi:asparagine synthetase B (glutamine-hydrolysing)